MDIVVIGGGAAGFFAAINLKEKHPDLQIALLEKNAQVLAKVRISGGGRCNVTHACFDPKKLVEAYPRGKKELLGPFFAFQPQDTFKWFEKRGVELKVEGDGRVFPVSDSSETIISCLKDALVELGIPLYNETGVTGVEKREDLFYITTKKQNFQAKRLILATGSSPQGLEIASRLGHTLVSPVPSLFTFNTPASPLLDLQGVSVSPVQVAIEKSALKETGPLLITHWGFSGPAVLKLSAFGARLLHEWNYKANLVINWVPELSKTALLEFKDKNPSKTLSQDPFEKLPKSLWLRLLELSQIDPAKKLAALSKAQLETLFLNLTQFKVPIDGKTTYKQEFVTAGGVELSQVNFKTMESKICPGLYFAGEILNIDGITGGFNFQNAWTTGWIIGEHLQS